MLSIVIDNLFIKGMIIVLAITTPYIKTTNEGAVLRSSFMNKDLWVVLSTITIFLYYNHFGDFIHKTNSFMILVLTLGIPCLFHFVNNKFIESKIILLCLYFIFDLFNDNKSMMDIIKTITGNVRENYKIE